MKLDWKHTAIEFLTRPIAISRVRREQRPTDRPTDGPTDGPTDRVAYRVACTRLKIWWIAPLIFRSESK